MKIRIRGLRIGDYDDIIALWKRGGMAYEPRGRESRAAISRQLKLNPGLYLGAFDGRRLVGVVLGTIDGRRGWLNRACIDPAHRRKGIARMLIVEMERRFLKKGIRLFAALVEEENKPSLALCESMSYVRRDDIVYMRKEVG